MKGFILTVVSVGAVGATPVLESCITRGNLVGVNKVVPGTPFDHVSTIVSDFDTDSKLTGVRACFNNIDTLLHMKSFRLDWLKSDGSPVSSPWVGLAETAEDTLC